VLPSKEYYLDANSTVVLDAYAELIRATATALGGQPDVVDRDVADLIQFETEMAKVLRSIRDGGSMDALRHPSIYHLIRSIYY